MVGGVGSVVIGLISACVSGVVGSVLGVVGVVGSVLGVVGVVGEMVVLLDGAAVVED